MNITPKFRLDQDDQFLIVTISVPYIRVSSAELIAEASTITFYCKPYLLKLKFPFDCEFDENESKNKTLYDPNVKNGTIIAHIAKRNIGKTFPDLDLTAQILQSTRRNKKIDEIDSVVNSDSFGYGFKNKYVSILNNLREEACEFLALEHHDPKLCSPAKRRVLRIQMENSNFDANRYLGDLVEASLDPIFAECMQYRPFWLDMWDKFSDLKKSKSTSDLGVAPVTLKERAFESCGAFTDEEQDMMTTIPIRGLESASPPPADDDLTAYLTLADVLYAYCYDCRLTQGDANVESSYCISRLSCSLSWLESWQLTTPRTAILFMLRRSLIYPYLRVWKLSRKVLADVAKLLLLGRKPVLKAILRIRRIFERTSTHYLLNRLYIDDLFAWLQLGVDAEGLQRFAVKFNEAKTKIETDSPKHSGKELVGFNIPQLEEWAEEQVCEADDEVDDDANDDGEEEDDDDCDEDASGSVDIGKQMELPSSVSNIPSQLLEYSTLPKDDSELFGYLSTELIDTETALGESSEDLAADHVRDLLTIPVITVPTLNHSEKVSRKGPLIQELSQSDDSPQIDNNHSVNKNSTTSDLKNPMAESETPSDSEENQLLKSMGTIRLS